jgi:hypothetical protein
MSARLNFPARKLPQAPVRYAELPLPEVRELYGDEAEHLWNDAFFNLYRDNDERAFAPTAAMPLY